MQKSTENGTGPVRVAMDAMGGDHGPVETVKGAISPDELGITLPHEHLLIDIWFFLHEPEKGSDK